MSEELKPCPFCACEDIEVYHHNNAMVGESWHVECQDEQCGNGTCHHDTRTQAITAWNTRADTDRITALIAAGDRLAGFVDHYNECDWADRERCECGLTEAMKAWREARGDD